MPLSLIFGEQDPGHVAPEVEHYFGVVGAAATRMCDGLYAGLGVDVLDDEDYAAMFPAEVPTPTTESANNVKYVQFPQTQPEIGAIATAREAVAASANVTTDGSLPFEVAAPAAPVAVPALPVDVTPIQDFPPVRNAA